MALISPTLPDVDVAEFRRLPRREQLRVMVEHWVDHGFGTPKAILLLYVVKLVGYGVGGLAIIAATTPGIGGLGDLATWWTEPVVLQKAVLWTLLFEVLGLGCGFGPLTLRFVPPLGTIFNWLRPGTTRLPPFYPLGCPDRRPPAARWWTPRCTFWWREGRARCFYRAARFGRPRGADDVGPAPPGRAGPLPGLFPPGRAARQDDLPGVQGRALPGHDCSVPVPHGDMVVGWKGVKVAIWWGAATSELTATSPRGRDDVTNSPVAQGLPAREFRDYPNDLRPSRLAGWLPPRHRVEYAFPLALSPGGGGIVTKVGLAIMLVFHPSSCPAWRWACRTSGILLPVLDGRPVRPPRRRSMLRSNPWLAVLILAPASCRCWATCAPIVSFLPAMRYYAGNWATSSWAFRDYGAEEKLHRGITKISRSVPDQLSPRTTTRPRAAGTQDLRVPVDAPPRPGTQGAAARAVDDLEAYTCYEGELIAGIVLGWNFGDGHLHNEPLLGAVQAQCHFEPGELRSSRRVPAARHPHQHYRTSTRPPGWSSRARSPWTT